MTLLNANWGDRVSIDVATLYLGKSVVESLREKQGTDARMAIAAEVHATDCFRQGNHARQPYIAWCSVANHYAGLAAKETT